MLSFNYNKKIVKYHPVNYIVFDIETTDIIGAGPITDLDIAVVSVYDSKTKSMQSFLEKDLSKMWPLFEKTDALVGYNTEHFDIPLLNKYYPGDLNRFKSIDLMVYIKNALGRRPKLDDVVKATLGSGKIASGLLAVEWWKAGRFDEVIKYCEEDVRLTNQLFEFARENKFVRLKNFNGETVKINLDTKDWEEKNDTAITHSMGF